ncbi:Chemotaxis protein CheY [Methanimicrococcus stummii]|uniref:Chemotaxis protein CheY n=1 Tax=Methanimicrococcus stummii TaxID=3028294 RepID=A0AA96ZYV2_9EURY|nr:response regulator [Methanimicrococcus sp. Es2]WNY28537.1 Chemotaxis protein CheY [Methanimicrococcus sp. Es2]
MQKKVLVVDDEDLLRDLLVQTIQNSGYAVEQAKDGESAVELYKKFSPDIVIMDIVMPNIDGIQATEKILQYDSDAVIVALTSFSSAKGDDILKAGVKEVIGKPIKSADLVEIIKKHLG